MLIGNIVYIENKAGKILAYYDIMKYHNSDTNILMI